MAIPNSKIVVVTGASSGIGKELRKLLTKHGNTVVNISRHPDESDDMSYAADIGDRERVNAVFREIGLRFGRIDILFCNAGYGLSGSVEHIPDTEIEKITDVNFLGAVWATRAALPYVPRGGRIIYTGSVSGIIPMPYRTMYNATKAALIEFAMSMSMELKPLGISSSVMLVAAVETDFAARRTKFSTDDARYAGAVSACDSFIDDKGGKNATGKLTARKAAEKIARRAGRRRAPLRSLIATPLYYLAYPLALLYPSFVIRVVSKVFMGNSGLSK